MERLKLQHLGQKLQDGSQAHFFYGGPLRPSVYLGRQIDVIDVIHVIKWTSLPLLFLYTESGQNWMLGRPGNEAMLKLVLCLIPRPPPPPIFILLFAFSMSIPDKIHNSTRWCGVCSGTLWLRETSILHS